jgi:acyl-CoA reductase-like NAD-dependent aldehyde dehydrogenase
MILTESQINAIVDRVVRRLSPELSSAPAAQPISAPITAPSIDGASPVRRTPKPTSGAPGRQGIFDDLESATQAAVESFERWSESTLERRAVAIEAMREVTRRHADELARLAVEETGLGNVKDKIVKNFLCANKTPGIEILKPRAFTGDHGMTLDERAPFGVIGAITPSTNPTETIINNAIGMVAAGNSVVFNVHPSAKRVSARHVQLLNEAIVASGGPENLIVGIAEPTIESAQGLMKHPNVRLIVVTGGPAVVRAAMSCGKRAIAAGPGNPPVVVDETAHLEKAARDIVDGASLDNNIVCIVEKEVFAVASIADRLKRLLADSGAFEVPSGSIDSLEKLVVREGHPAREWIGKDAMKIAEAAGLRVPTGTRLLFAEVDATHSFVQAELLMPVIGFVRLRQVEDCIAAAVQAEHGFGHTAVMHSTNIDHLHAMAKVIDTSIFVKNGPSYAGLGMTGEGYTSFTIASPTGEGLTTALTFTRERRCTLKDHFRIV